MSIFKAFGNFPNKDLSVDMDSNKVWCQPSRTVVSRSHIDQLTGQRVVIGDFNGDEKMDMLCFTAQDNMEIMTYSSETFRKMNTYRLDQTQGLLFKDPTLYSVGHEFKALVGDFDGNGIDDIIFLQKDQNLKDSPLYYFQYFKYPNNIYIEYTYYHNTLPPLVLNISYQISLRYLVESSKLEQASSVIEQSEDTILIAWMEVPKYTDQSKLKGVVLSKSKITIIKEPFIIYGNIEPKHRFLNLKWISSGEDKNGYFFLTWINFVGAGNESINFNSMKVTSQGNIIEKPLVWGGSNKIVEKIVSPSDQYDCKINVSYNETHIKLFYKQNNGTTHVIIHNISDFEYSENNTITEVIDFSEDSAIHNITSAIGDFERVNLKLVPSNNTDKASFYTLAKTSLQNSQSNYDCSFEDDFVADDFDGDGKSEILCLRKGELFLYDIKLAGQFYFMNSTKLENIGYNGKWCEETYNSQIDLPTGNNDAQVDLSSGDFDGDGNVDLWAIVKRRYSIGEDDGFYKDEHRFLKNMGDGRSFKTFSNSYDGYIEFPGQDGTWVIDKRYGENSDIFRKRYYSAADYDGDGKTDLFAYQRDDGESNLDDVHRGLYLLKSGIKEFSNITKDIYGLIGKDDYGSGVIENLIERSNCGDNLRFADFNGDKITEIFCQDDDGRFHILASSIKLSNSIAVEDIKLTFQLIVRDFVFGTSFNLKDYSPRALIYNSAKFKNFGNKDADFNTELTAQDTITTTITFASQFSISDSISDKLGGGTKVGGKSIFKWSQSVSGDGGTVAPIPRYTKSEEFTQEINYELSFVYENTKTHVDTKQYTNTSAFTTTQQFTNAVKPKITVQAGQCAYFEGKILKFPNIKLPFNAKAYINGWKDGVQLVGDELLDTVVEFFEGGDNPTLIYNNGALNITRLDLTGIIETSIYTQMEGSIYSCNISEGL